MSDGAFNSSGNSRVARWNTFCSKGWSWGSRKEKRLWFCGRRGDGVPAVGRKDEQVAVDAAEHPAGQIFVQQAEVGQPANGRERCKVEHVPL